jgi:capsular exopolysaccharide synthesis family protein
MAFFKSSKNKKTPVSTRNYKQKLLDKNSPFAITESFKKLRTNILFSTSNIKCPVIGITSAYQETGKSILSSNLGISFSQLEKRVLIIDCDLRKPVQHKIFQIENNSGISDMLAGIEKNNITICQLENYENLSLITAGSIPPNPSELLASENMVKLISVFRENFDLIIIDLPPINMVTDAAVVSSIVDGYLFIIRMEHDEVRSVQEAIATLESSEAKIFGVVLNDVNPKTGKYYKNYNKYGNKYYKYKNYNYNAYDSSNYDENE